MRGQQSASLNLNAFARAGGQRDRAECVRGARARRGDQRTEPRRLFQAESWSKYWQPQRSLSPYQTGHVRGTSVNVDREDVVRMCPPRGRRRASPHWHLLDATSPTSSRPGEHRPAQRQLTNPATRRRRRRPRASRGRGLTTGRCTLASASRRCRRRRDRDEQLQPRRRSKWRSEACESACRSLNSNNSEATAVQRAK